MRIAQVAPLFEAVPPKLYGGTERVVWWLTEELVKMGHDVTLFASGDSVTSAKLDPMIDQAIRLDPTVKDWIAYYMRMMELIRRRAHEFDVIHFHTDYFPFSLFSRQDTPFVTTMHGRLDLPEFKLIYETFPDVPLVSISNHQRLPLPNQNWAKTVYHGLPAELLMPQPVEQEYFAFLGRISPEKGVDRAIRVAAKCGMKLKVAAKVDNADKKYYENEIKPLMAQGHVEFIGEINDAQKPAFLSGAKALMFPIDWPEPFGLVMIESMACGTPVVAYGHGSVPEVIDDGLTGFIIEPGNEEAFVAAAKKVDTLSRARIRAQFERRFTSRRMAEDYLSVYEQIGARPVPQLRAVGD